MASHPITAKQAANLRATISQRDAAKAAYEAAQKVTDVYLLSLLDGLDAPPADGTVIGLAADGSPALEWADPEVAS